MTDVTISNITATDKEDHWFKPALSLKANSASIGIYLRDGKDTKRVYMDLSGQQATLLMESLKVLLKNVDRRQ